MNRQVWVQIIAPQHPSCGNSFPAVTPLPLKAHLVFTPPTVLNFGKLGTLLSKGHTTGTVCSDHICGLVGSPVIATEPGEGVC